MDHVRENEHLPMRSKHESTQNGSNQYSHHLRSLEKVVNMQLDRIGTHPSSHLCGGGKEAGSRSVSQYIVIEKLVKREESGVIICKY